MRITKLFLASLLLFAALIDIQAQSDWSQWGGPRRDFTTTSKGLAATWPATGPKQLWTRPLGAGHSAILEIAYQDRTFPKSNFVLADGKLIILDEDGNLALATATPTALKVISKVSVLKNLAWTVPTLVGTKLYLRDRRTITALDLS